ncbi:MAG: TonB-dependent receptor [Moraxellaceae bacterium]|nr:TonB-dependent receptor [Moraxellaceae bacterium]
MLFARPLAAGFLPRLLPLCLLAAAPAFADHSQEHVLPAVVVNTEAESAVTTVPSAAAVRAAQQGVAGGVAVVEAETWREGRAATPEDMLRHAPGMFAASRFGSEESRLSVRGSGLQRTFHGRGLMFLQDGVPLTLADGGGDFQAMEPLATRYVEVLRGANALQYGSGTLGGAVNFVTPSGRDAGTELRVEGGSFGHQRLYLQTAGAGERTDGFVSLSHYGRDGFQDHAEQSTQRLFANAGYRNSATLEQRVYFSAVRTDSELPGSLTEAERRAGDVRKAAPGNVTGDNKRDFDLYRVAYKLNWLPVEGGKLEFSSFYAQKDLFHPIFQVLEQKNDDYGSDLRWTKTAPFGRSADRFVVGGRLHFGDTRDDRFVNVGGQSAARTDQSDQRAENTTLYGEYTLGLSEAWAVVGGVQQISSLRRFDDLCHAGTVPACNNNPSADASFSKRFDETLPRLGVITTLDNGVQFFANASALYEPPSFGEINGGNVVQLDAQEGRSLEIGSRGSLPEQLGLEWDVALYHARLDKELLAVLTAPNTYSTLNADRTVHRGLEAALSLRPLPALQVRLNYLHNDFRFDGDAVYGDNRIAGVPERVLNGEFLLRLDDMRLYVGPTLQAASSSWVDHRNLVAAPGYAVYGLKLGQQLTPAFSWFLEGRNLTDKVYAATHNVVGDGTLLSFGQPQRLFNPGDGRAVYAGLTWTP